MRQTNVAGRGRVAIGLFGILCVSAGVRAQPLPTLDFNAKIPGFPSVARLYLGSALQFVPSPVLGASTGSGSWMSGTRFYLLSADGRVYRGYRLPKAPGGDIQRFDFEKAKTEDPYNSGVFVVESDRVLLRFGGGVAPQEESSPVPKANGPLEINGTRYPRQPLK